METTYNNEEASVLIQAMYGLVQATWQFFNKIRDTLVKELNFKKRLSDQCLLVQENDYGTIIVCLYIDDTLVVGIQKAVEKLKAELVGYKCNDRQAPAAEPVTTIP